MKYNQLIHNFFHITFCRNICKIIYHKTFYIILLLYKLINRKKMEDLSENIDSLMMVPELIPIDLDPLTIVNVEIDTSSILSNDHSTP